MEYGRIKKEWENFSATVLGNYQSELSLTIGRCSFYAGYLRCLNVFAETLPPHEKPEVSRLAVELYKEVDEFTKSLVMKVH